MLKPFFITTVCFLVLACESQPKDTTTQGVEEKKIEKETIEAKTKKKITGQWSAQEIDSVENTESWTFNESELHWENFVHPYTISNDTIYISGQPYTIHNKGKDTIEFSSEKTNKKTVLVRAK